MYSCRFSICVEDMLSVMLFCFCLFAIYDMNGSTYLYNTLECIVVFNVRHGVFQDISRPRPDTC